MSSTTSRSHILLLAVLLILLQLTSAGTMRKRSLPPTPPVADHIDPDFPMSFAETVTHTLDARSMSCSNGVQMACAGAAFVNCSGENCKVCCNDCCRFISGMFLFYLSSFTENTPNTIYHTHHSILDTHPQYLARKRRHTVPVIAR